MSWENRLGTSDMRDAVNLNSFAAADNVAQSHASFLLVVTFCTRRESLQLAEIVKFNSRAKAHAHVIQCLYI